MSGKAHGWKKAGRRAWFKRPARWAPLLALAALLAVAAVHFGPRYVYYLFGYLALDKVPSEITPKQRQVIQAATKGLKAKIVWSSSRSGNHEIYMLTLPGMNLYRLTNNDRVDFYPRFSPDGRELVFARSQKKWVSERNWKLWDVIHMRLAGGKERLLAKNGDYPLWVGPREVSFSRGNQVVLKSLASGKERVIFDSTGPPLEGTIGTPALSPRDRNLLAVAARGKHDGVFVVDLAKNTIQKMGQGCELGWFPDGRRLYWVEPHGRGGTRVMTSPLRPVRPRVFMDKPGRYSHEYFVRFSQDGRWMVWAGSAGGHEHDIADYEIFLWDTTKPPEQAVRLTYNKGNDRWPDIFVEK